MFFHTIAPPPPWMVSIDARAAAKEMTSGTSFGLTDMLFLPRTSYHNFYPPPITPNPADLAKLLRLAYSFL